MLNDTLVLSARMKIFSRDINTVIQERLGPGYFVRLQGFRDATGQIIIRPELNGPDEWNYPEMEINVMTAVAMVNVVARMWNAGMEIGYNGQTNLVGTIMTSPQLYAGWSNMASDHVSQGMRQFGRNLTVLLPSTRNGENPVENPWFIDDYEIFDNVGSLVTTSSNQQVQLNHGDQVGATNMGIDTQLTQLATPGWERHVHYAYWT